MLKTNWLRESCVSFCDAVSGLRPDGSLSDLVRDVKAGASRFIKEERRVHGRFSWQEGLGALSCSRSQLGAVVRHIENQQQHPAGKSFTEECQTLLGGFGVEYDPRYIFESGEATE